MIGPDVYSFRALWRHYRNCRRNKRNTFNAKAQNNYSAYVPDLPGCVATGATIDEVEAQIREAIDFDGLREDGAQIPQPSSRVEYVEVAA